MINNRFNVVYHLLQVCKKHGLLTNKLNKMRKFKVKEDCFCEGYLHEKFNYPREGLIEKKLLKDDEVELKEEWSNFYGSYMRVIKDGKNYDILHKYLQEIRQC